MWGLGFQETGLKQLRGLHFVTLAGSYLREEKRRFILEPNVSEHGPGTQISGTPNGCCSVQLHEVS